GRVRYRTGAAWLALAPLSLGRDAPRHTRPLKLARSVHLSTKYQLIHLLLPLDQRHPYGEQKIAVQKVPGLDADADLADMKPPPNSHNPSQGPDEHALLLRRVEYGFAHPDKPAGDVQPGAEKYRPHITPL